MERTKVKHVLNLLAIIVSVFFMGYFIEKGVDITATNVKDSLENYLDISFELISAFISFSIFTITWHAYGKSRDNHSLFLGGAFLVIGLLIVFHTFSYPFMPDFLTPNSFHKAAVFLIESRLILALSLLASVYIYKRTLPKLINKAFILASAIVLSAISLAFVLPYHETLFEPNEPNNGYSTAMIFLLSIITVIILGANYLYARRLKETGEKNQLFLIYGSNIIAFSNLVYLSYEFSGHLLIIIGFFFMYLALYKSSVELPYEKLMLAEEKLSHAAEERYKNIVELTTDIIYTSDIDGNQTFMNNAAYRILDFKPEEIIGHPWSKLIHPDDKDRTFKKFKEMIELGVDVFAFENRYLSKSGKVIHALHNVKVLRNENGEIVGTLGIARDITEHKKAEEISRQNEYLEFTNKTKSEFLATMSHELRTPLNSVIGFSELLKQGTVGALNEKQKRYVDNVMGSGKHLLDLISDVLDLSKIEAGKIGLVDEKVYVQATIDEIISLMEEKAVKNNIILKKDFDPALDYIEADKIRFKQIIFNLLSNAIKFSNKTGGTVTVTAMKKGDMAKILVSDTGIGINEEDIGKLFKEFVQLDSGITRKYGGTGLGLAITKKLVELHGGKIWVDSEFGVGSTFTFLLPIKANKGKCSTVLGKQIAR
jgi:PAS domain S-box-containing protein